MSSWSATGGEGSQYPCWDSSLFFTRSEWHSICHSCTPARGGQEQESKATFFFILSFFACPKKDVKRTSFPRHFIYDEPFGKLRFLVRLRRVEAFPSYMLGNKFLFILHHIWLLIVSNSLKRSYGIFRCKKLKVLAFEKAESKEWNGLDSVDKSF